MARFTVTNTNDSGAGSLRQAITNANALSGKDIINFCGVFDDGLAHTISLTGGGLSITDDITILGRNPNLLTISDDSASRVFDITSGATATINGLTITNTYHSAGGGGGISNEGVLTLNNSIITGNTAGYSFDSYKANLGGGIYNTGTLTVNHSIISDNLTTNYSSITFGRGGPTITTLNAYGNGIYNSGNLTLNDSNISGNGYVRSPSLGGAGLDSVYNRGYLTVNHSTINGNYNGAIGNQYGNLTVDYSTISGNTLSTLNFDVAAGGGGIYNSLGNVTVNYSNITDNTSTVIYGGGGIYNESMGTSFGNEVGDVTVNYSTISGNTSTSTYSAGGGIYNGGRLTVNYSNITDNQAPIGGGIDNRYGATLIVNYSSINGNTADKAGGGIFNESTDIYTNANNPLLGVVIVSNSTIADNQAHFGAGIYNDGTLTVGNSVIKHNKAFGIELSSGGYEFGDGGGIYNNSTYGTTTIDYSAIACNFDTCQEDSNNRIQPDDIAGNFINNGYNWIGINTATTAAGDAA